MIDLTKCVLPQAIEVGGSLYRIKTDYRYFLMLRNVLKNKGVREDDIYFLMLRNSLKNKDIREDDIAFMYVHDKPADWLAGLKALCEFMTPPQELPRRTGQETNEIVVDYEIDAPYIYAAFYEQYGIDLLTARLHWYQFNALFYGLHDTELNNIISARLYKPSGRNDEYEKTRQKQYEAWRLPQPADNVPDEALEDFLGALKG